MPEQEKRYGTKITAQGASRITACILAGTKLQITQAAAGDGGGGYYVPSVDQTALMGERWRGPIVSALQNPTVTNMLDVKIVIDDSVGNFVCREMGLFSEDGALIAVCNTPDTEKVAISTGVDGRLTMVMHIVVADSSVLEFTIVPALNTVSREDLEQAISEHNADAAAHPDLRQEISDTVAAHNTDRASHADIRQAIPDAVKAHNTAPAAHPDLRSSMAGLEAAVQAMALKWSTNVTENAFTVTFEALDEVDAAGVWNVPMARIEF